METGFTEAVAFLMPPPPGEEDQLQGVVALRPDDVVRAGRDVVNLTGPDENGLDPTNLSSAGSSSRSIAQLATSVPHSSSVSATGRASIPAPSKISLLGVGRARPFRTFSNFTSKPASAKSSRAESR